MRLSNAHVHAHAPGNASRNPGRSRGPLCQPMLQKISGSEGGRVARVVVPIYDRQSIINLSETQLDTRGGRLVCVCVFFRKQGGRLVLLALLILELCCAGPWLGSVEVGSRANRLDFVVLVFVAWTAKHLSLSLSASSK
jgi:hypothetical protein